MAETSPQETAPADLERILQKSLEKSRELYVYLLYFITEVARYAETDSRQRRSKNLPSREDLEVNTKIAANLTVVAILENTTFQQ
ncbi:MAG: transcription antitermination factor NusB, partial [Burkholderiaceae bacterium]|nr:transcription antitermination factor NusB [Burkholderiaceae bacterium]